MAKHWYMVQTYTGYEQKIERTLKAHLEKGELDSSIVTSVVVPMKEVVTQTKDGKKRTIHEKILPGYIMLELDLPEIGWKDTCSIVRRVQGVNGFVGTDPNELPRPISDKEAINIFQLTGEIKGGKSSQASIAYNLGDHVKIKSGPFESFCGVVEEINADKDKLRVNVQIFGRATPVEVSVSQVDKI